MIRWSTVTIILGALVAGILYDRIEHSAVPVEPVLAERIATPTLSEDTSLSTDWYCPVGSTDDAGFATHVVYISNLAEEPAIATIETLTNDGPGTGLRLELAPLTTETVDLADLAVAPAVAATVEIIGGEGIVGHSVDTELGRTEGPCSTASSDTWYFGGGVTTRDARYYLSLMNPSLNAVVFSATFRTDTRLRSPQDLEAAVVPPQSVRVIDVTEFVAREPLVSAEIRTVQGRLVAERLQTFDGTLGPLGATMQLGVASPAPDWSFASGVITESNDNKLAITNPTEESAELDLYLVPSDAADLVSYGLLPREITVAPGRTVVVDVQQMALDIGLILPYELGLRLISANGVSVVAERWHFSPAIDETLIGAGGINAKVKSVDAVSPLLRQDGDTGEVPIEEIELPSSALALVQPAPISGVVMNRGVENSSDRWVIPWITLSDEGSTALVLAAGEEAASVEIRLLVAGEWQPPIRARVDEKGRLIVPLVSAAGAAPVLITSDVPLWVEGQIVIPGGRHDIVPAIPTVAPTN